MLLASNTGAGQNMGFPDVCNTPGPSGTAPVPYPNIAMNAQASPFSQTVRVSGMNALNMTSKIPMTTGDEAGVAHPFFKQMGGYQVGNPCVYIEGSQAINLSCPTNGNNMNNSAGVVAVPSVTTVFFTLRPSAETLRADRFGRERIGPSAGGAHPPCGASRHASQPRAATAPLDPYGRSLDGARLAELGAAMDRPSVDARPLGDGVVYLRIALFNAAVPTLVFRALRKHGGKGIRALIVDLRGNPGGDTEAMARLADDFLPRDAVIVRAVRDGDETLSRARHGVSYDHPLVLLVDGATASAAELFAGCMKHHRRARIVGERTYGKGALQAVVPDVAGSGVYYASVARCLLPGGEEVEGVGIEPDERVPGGAREADPVLERARALVR